MNILCFDIGGTSIKYKIYKNEKTKVYSIPTRKTETDNMILEDILEIIENYKNEIVAVGVSTAGVVDNIKGEIIYAGPTIPNYTGTKIKESIESKFGIKTFVENDVNSAGIGEYIHSNLDGTTFCMTVGTGLGGSIILNNKVYTGSSMTAGEIGYMPYRNTELQKIASTSYFTKTLSEKFGMNIDGIRGFELVKSNNKIAISVLDEVIEGICHAILNVSYILNPKYVIIGGGISAQGDFLYKLIKSKLDKKIIDKKFSVELRLANLANEAGLYGIYNIVKEGLK